MRFWSKGQIQMKYLQAKRMKLTQRTCKQQQIIMTNILLILKNKQQMEKQLKYKDLLLQSDEEKKEADVVFTVEEARQSLESDILATKKSLATALKNRNRTIGKRKFDSQAIIAIDNEIEALQAGLEKLNALKTELF
jgi:hypothetical protein